MKHLLLSITLIIGLQTFAQTEKDVIKNQTLAYFEMVENNDAEGVMNSLHPKVFETIPREQMKAGMEQMLNNEDMKIEFLTTTLSNISDIIEHEGSKYCLIDYANDMRMTFLSEKDKSEEEKKAFMDIMKSTMDAQFGAENVKVDAETVSLVIYIESNIYAIYNKDMGGWKFLGNDANMKTITDKVIPSSIQEQLIEQKN